MTIQEEIVERVQFLPEDKQREVLTFIESLASEKEDIPKAGLRQDWAGALSEYEDGLTSVELQKKALEWRVERLVERRDE
ncbi:MAG: DUF2281 domain-containing protein [Chloroflexi bacterium]|nr:DUF2281 domain-containing protein [Chloroflexota bacterium]